MTAPRFDPTLQYGRSDFGEAEQRLRRLLALEGLVPMDLGRELTPVMLVGDGTVPGMGTTRLRRFGVGNIQNTIAGQGFWLKCNRQDGVILDELDFLIGAVGQMRLKYLGPANADPVPIATATGIMLDRAETSGEASPMLISAQDVTGGSVTTDIFWGSSNVNFPIGRHTVRLDMFLAFGAKIAFGGNQVATWSVRGKTF